MFVCLERGKEMTEDSRSRKWQVTINNPIDKGYTHDKIKEIMKEYTGCVYWCMADETGEEGTFHTHIFLVCSNAVKFSVMLKRFMGGHCEMCRGTSAQNREYVFKQGKWKNTEKETTNYEESHYESGELPVERQGKRNDLEDLYDMINAGMTDAQILKDSPSYMLHLDSIRKTREITRAEKFEGVKRMDLEVTYIYGKAGTGKTRSVFDKYGADAYMVSDYKHPFDEYAGQPVMVFDEFRSSINMSCMLRYLDVYPLVLPARYSNKCACYTKVFIISNVSLLRQYDWYQKNEPETWEAFARRIHKVRIHKDNRVKEVTIEEFLNGFSPCIGRTPFD